MKRISQILAALLLSGCHADPPVVKSSYAALQPATRHSGVDSTRLQAIQDSLAVLAAAPDTFRASNGQVFRMREISKARYEAASGPGLERTFPPDSAAAMATERAFIKTAAGRVWRAADTLFFRTGNGPVSWLHDGPTYQDADDSYEGYRYLANLPEIQQWLVEVGQWEGRHYLLIDQQTGKNSKLISYPIISPDHKRFACANADPTGYSLEGIQLWQKPAGQPPQLRWQRLSNALQDGITAVAPRWEGNTTLSFYEDFITAGKYVQVRL